MTWLASWVVTAEIRLAPPEPTACGFSGWERDSWEGPVDLPLVYSAHNDSYAYIDTVPAAETVPPRRVTRNNAALYPHVFASGDGATGVVGHAYHAG